ncbi:2-haloacrylate reductase isoform B [Micractinium conductrix]|uniref:2-haloacrylate reductase isoform B n=1 Tax=Micractinium conductrix TaxID=554055 RepID=A0A2P6VRI4_9CHLO|nr:2-haloacrylate reductase isoform B [Micractinium conductrix]|eukprot:PSC76708.1 2-haloacrylate reductase isoform B [Micractinium conductrix]
MGNRIARLAYTDECAAAARTVLQARSLSQRAMALSPAGETELYASVHSQLRAKGLGMPPGVDRHTLAESVRQLPPPPPPPLPPPAVAAAAELEAEADALVVGAHLARTPDMSFSAHFALAVATTSAIATWMILGVVAVLLTRLPAGKAVNLRRILWLDAAVMCVACWLILPGAGVLAHCPIARGSVGARWP